MNIAKLTLTTANCQAHDVAYKFVDFVHDDLSSDRQHIDYMAANNNQIPNEFAISGMEKKTPVEWKAHYEAKGWAVELTTELKSYEKGSK